ncbi:MAG: SusD/RagB family nutrient-binding outer membrane lipoprotein [Deinococcales bacterium]|nr:SusD/RagB family nutrient-binding outer membrane lipoprotein [Chitinophagaceae bacterium]
MKKSFIIILAFSLVTITSCNKAIDETYANPNAAVRVPIEELLPQITSAFAGNYGGHGSLNDARFTGSYTQNFAYATAADTYDQMYAGLTDNNASWYRVHYYDFGENLIKIIKWGTEEKKWDYVGVANAIFAFSWLTLTDTHGEVTLKEAFNSSQLTFKYDTQPEVYEFARNQCFTALDFLNRTGDNVSQANLAKGDQFFYGGDVTKWKKFVYAVLARYHNHLSNKPTYKADSVIYYANLSMKTNADNATVKYAATGISATNNLLGPLRNNIGSVGRFIRQSEFIANLMNGTNTAFATVADPRAWYLLRGNTNGTIKGVPPNRGQLNGLAQADRPESFFGISQNATSVVNSAPVTDVNCRYIFRNASPTPIITASEVQFMKAEAAFIKGDKATALEAYKLGIQLNFDLLMIDYNVNIPTGRTITTTIRDAFLNNPLVVPTATNLTLSHIMLQKYIALYGYGNYETWVDLRRYHYKDVDANGLQVYRDFAVPTGTALYIDNGGNPIYRVRPRFNSEYVWNLEELKRIGADANNYHTKECWFSMK